jgi:hypothetical protein
MESYPFYYPQTYINVQVFSKFGSMYYDKRLWMKSSLAELLSEGLTANAKVATSSTTIPASSDTAENKVHKKPQ